MSVPLPNPDSRTTDTIRAGLNHAARLLADLCSRNSEYRDAQAGVATFLAWILDDHPSFASQLDASGVTAYFARRLGRFLFLAVNQERLKAGYEEAVGQPVARPVETAPNSGFVRAALRHALPRWSTEAVEDSIDDAIILLDSWKSQNEKSEIVKAQLARRYLVKELTPALQALRQRAKAVHPETCFLVSPCDAPKALRTYICEKIAIVIPLAATFDESWIFHCKDSGVSFRELVIEDAVAPPSIPVMMAFDSGRTLFDFEGLRERVFRHFRAELPVIYVSSRATVLGPVHTI